MSLKKSYLFVLIILLIDQASKIYVKTNFNLWESIKVFNQEWFQIYFVENEGMAWGIEIPGQYGKLFLTSFRILAIGGIIWWLHDTYKKNGSNILKVAIVCILAGAIGNIIDSVFYGVIFDHSNYQHATLFTDKPYGEWFHGRVVDMFYFPIVEFENVPSWFPFKDSNGNFTFFNAIFNVADVAISTGFGILIVFNKRCFDKVSV